MSTTTEWFRSLTSNIRVELLDEFDRNFERKSFFDTKVWPSTKKPVKIGSLLARTNRMRQSLRAQSTEQSITFTSSVPYFAIHNDGGIIKRTSTKGKSYTINMPQRQIVGVDPKIDEIVKGIVDEAMPNILNMTIKLWNI